MPGFKILAYPYVGSLDFWRIRRFFGIIYADRIRRYAN